MARKKNTKRQPWGTVVAVFILAALVGGGIYVLSQTYLFPVLQPSGSIAQQQRDLLAFSFWLMLTVVVPVFAMLFYFAWRYRANNEKKYTPTWDGNRLLETLWWGIPGVLIGVLAVITLQSSHSLDPYKPLAHSRPPFKVQVVALQWKWLFLYPDQKVASVNELRIPVGRPVEFTLTSDAPMNSFWIPSLGGQIYAMAGMQTTLHLIADAVGDYAGLSANISGTYFERMKFQTIVREESETLRSLTEHRAHMTRLDNSAYLTLAQPAIVEAPQYYRVDDETLFSRIVNVYSVKDTRHDSSETGDTMQHSMEGMGH